jgi:hypothetical protein
MNQHIDKARPKIGLAIMLIVFSALPANKVVAQHQLKLSLPGNRHELTVNNNVQWSEPLSRRLAMDQTKMKYFKVSSERNQIFSDFDGEDSSNAGGRYHLPFPSIWVGSKLGPTMLNIKDFNLAGSIYYDNDIDELGFNLVGQLKASNRLSIQLAVFVFYVPRPWITSTGVGSDSEISNYQLTGLFCLQKYK